LFTRGKQSGDRATCLLTRLGLLKSALSDNSNFETLIVLRWLAVLGIPLKEGDLAFRADKYGGNSYRVVERWTSSDAESVTEIVS
jgi:hypothetical protein